MGGKTVWSLVAVLLSAGCYFGAWYAFDWAYESLWPMPSSSRDIREWESRFGRPGARESGMVLPARPDTHEWYEWDARRNRLTHLAAVIGGIAALIGYFRLWVKFGRLRESAKVLGLVSCVVGLVGISVVLVMASNASLFGTDGSPTGIILVFLGTLLSGVFLVIGLLSLRQE